MTTDSSKYNCDPKPKGSSMVLALPGAGGNLLLELMAVAGRTEVTGTQEPSFYHAITAISESISSNANDYGRAEDVARGENGLRFYARDRPTYDANLTYYNLKNILLKGCSSCALGLTDRLRDEGQGWVE